jgi:hypothetical protein
MGDSNNIERTTRRAVLHNDPQVAILVVGAVELHDVLAVAVSQDHDLRLALKVPPS